MLKEIILKNRSYRRFHEDETISSDTLKELIELARLSPSGANLQPLKYIISVNPETNAQIFPHLKWAGYLLDWTGPKQGERPSAYIIILGDSTITKKTGYDPGIAAQSIMLGAAEKGLGGCMIGSIDREGIAKELYIKEEYEILLVLALGKPKEEVLLEEITPQSGIRYWRDTEGKHHVPKRTLDELIIKIKE